MRVSRGWALAALWATTKVYALWAYVFAPDEYSDAYYYFLQAEAAAAGGGLAALTPEYPTPAAALLALPYWLGAHDHAAYRLGFLALIVAADAAFAALLIRRSHPLAVVAWSVLTLAAGRLALLRLDLFPAVAVGAALWCLLHRRPAWAGVLLAVGTGLKAWPILLLPLAAGAARRWWSPVLACAGTGAVLAAASVTAGGWARLLSPLGYQRDRGLQVEAIAATWPMWARLDDPAYIVDYSRFSAFEIAGPGVPALLAATSWATALGLLGCAALIVRWWCCAPPGRRGEAAGYLALTAVGVFMITSKVLSPQYLLWWAAPVVVLLGEASSPSSTTAPRSTTRPWACWAPSWA